MSLFFINKTDEFAGFVKKTCIFSAVVLEYIRLQKEHLRKEIWEMEYFKCSSEELEKEYAALKKRYKDEKEESPARSSLTFR